MAKRIKAINAMRPRLKRQPTVEEASMIRHIAETSGLREAQITHVLMEVRAAIEHFITTGASMRVTGLGLITPGMDTQGRRTIRILPDPDLVNAINRPDNFFGEIINARNLGKSGNELVALWNAANPEDPVDA